MCKTLHIHYLSLIIHSCHLSFFSPKIKQGCVHFSGLDSSFLQKHYFTEKALHLMQVKISTWLDPKFPLSPNPQLFMMYQQLGLGGRGN